MSGYTKLFGSILDSTVWELPHTTVRVWFTLMAMADRHGEVQASIPGLAHRSRVTLEETEKALNAFLSPDKYSRTPDQDGRRIEPVDGGWRLINHGKYTRMMSEEDRRARGAERQARYVESKKRQQASASVSSVSKRQNDDTQTQTYTQTKTQTDPEQILALASLGVPRLPAGFAEFWAAYPRKTKRGAALKAWNAQKPPLSEVLKALGWQREQEDWTKERGKYVPYPASYLNAQQWLDEPSSGASRIAEATRKIFDVAANWVAMKERAENGK